MGEWWERRAICGDCGREVDTTPLGGVLIHTCLPPGELAPDERYIIDGDGRRRIMRFLGPVDRKQPGKTETDNKEG